MMAGPGEGFNAFRRWPSSSSVCLTSSAWSHLGLDGAMHELSVPELYDCIGDEDKAEDIIKAMPMPDQPDASPNAAFPLPMLDLRESGHPDYRRM